MDSSRRPRSNLREEEYEEGTKGVLNSVKDEVIFREMCESKRTLFSSALRSCVKKRMCNEASIDPFFSQETRVNFFFPRVPTTHLNLNMQVFSSYS